MLLLSNYFMSLVIDVVMVFNDTLSIDNIMYAQNEDYHHIKNTHGYQYPVIQRQTTSEQLVY